MKRWISVLSLLLFDILNSEPLRAKSSLIDPDLSRMWQFFSALPGDLLHPNDVHPWDKEHGSGMYVDRAWEIHQGDPSTLIVVLDSGIRWGDDELAESLWINRGELPFPEGHGEYDANQDGRFNAFDYAHDSRVNDVNQNGRIDPQDLIHSFSNHIDDDQNGFVDDISGWDFMEGDHDPEDRTNFGHGTGEARGSVGGLNNGIAAAGACGRCTVMMVRIADSFVVTAERFAEAVHYAAKFPVKVIQQATGAINHSQRVLDAIEESTNKGISIVGTAADENSFHSNFSSVSDPVIYVNALRHDQSDYREATTFSHFNHCSNYGARVDVSASALSCSSEATALVSGIVGLAYSYAGKKGTKIDPLQMLALLKNSADDVDKSFLTYPSATKSADPRFTPGWDMMSGSGRVNAYRILSAIEQGKIPPHLRVKSPEWFSVIRLGEKPTLPLELEVGDFGDQSALLKVYVQHGVDTWSANGIRSEPLLMAQKYLVPTVQSLRMDLPMDQILNVQKKPQHEPLYENAWTIIVELSTTTNQIATARRTFLILDPQAQKILDGYPRKMTGSAEGNVMMLDIDGHLGDEIVVADGQGWLHAYQQGGREITGFPVDVGGSVYAPLAAGDLNGDGQDDIIGATTNGQVFAISSNGKMLKGFPQKISRLDFSQMNSEEKLDEGIMAAPAIVDVDGDYNLDIVVVTLDGKLTAIRSNGEFVAGYPVEIKLNNQRARLLSSPAIIDINQDGIFDFVFGSNHVEKNSGSVFAIDGRGNLSPKIHIDGFPARIPLLHDAILPTVGTGIPTSPVIMDFDGDGVSEIVMHGFVGKTYLVSMQGRITQSMSMEIPPNENQMREKFMISAFGHPGVARFFPNILSLLGIGVGQRILTSILLGAGPVDFDHLLGAWSADGKMIKQWPKKISGMALGVSPVSADIDGDGRDEVFVGTSTMTIHGYDHQGELQGFPKITGGWMMGAPSIGDHDGDGLADIAAATREGYVYVWKIGVARGFSSIWPTFKGNNARTGNVFLPRRGKAL